MKSYQDLLKIRRKLKAKFQRREKVFLAWTSFGYAPISEIFCRSGVDAVGIDLEHSTISLDQAREIISVCHAQGILCLPRISSHNAEMARRLLDAGADGLIVPMVNTAADVEAIVNWSKYPPKGKRGFGVARAQGYGFDFNEYIRSWNDSSIIIVQVESIEAVGNIDEILANKDVDGVMVGPYDISGSLKVPGQLEHPKVQAACRQVLKACKRHGVSVGTQVVEPDERSLKKAFARSFTFVALASDVFLLWKWSARIKTLTKKFS